MTTAVIDKIANGTGPLPNLRDYRSAYESFSWSGARAELDGLPHGRGLNIAHEAIDRHVAQGHGDKTAFRWLAKDGSRHDFTYGALGAASNRFANVLRHLGVGDGDRVFALAGRIPALYITALGTWKAKDVFCTMFSAFGPEPIRARMTIGGAKLLITTASLYEKKIAPIRAELGSLEHVLLVNEDAGAEALPGTLSYTSLMAKASDVFEIPPTAPEDPALLHFTSGTTGTPKGAVHVHEAVVAHHITGKLALDLHPEDIFWCTADPGWVTGTSYGIIAPLTNGVTSIVDEQDFDAERWYEILKQQAVSVWYTAPTAIRMMMKAGLDLARARRLPALRFLASVGEPLNPEAVRWGVEAFNLPFHDNWWQTETGGIMIANFPSMPIRPGSMGKPMPGIEAAIVQTLDRCVHVLDTPNADGELALKPGWPSMFRAYLNEPERYAKCFAGSWYLTGDLVRRDADGYLWFVGRKDDVIKTSGHLIGPFEVESVLMERPAVAEAGVIGKPDPVAMEIVKAFVALKHGYEERSAEAYSEGKIRGFLHLYIGEEAVAVGAMQALEPEDAIVATYREHGQALARGVSPGGIMAEMYGKSNGVSRGRGGSMHLFDVTRRFYGGHAIVGGGLPFAVGIALAHRMQGKPLVTACFFGEGAVAEGEFHESLNLAVLWKLPVLFLCENNLYAMGTGLDRSESEQDIHLKAQSYRIPSEAVDGMDVLAVEEAARRGAAHVRRGDGPYFIELRTYRFRAHSMADPELYRSKSEVTDWKTRDPIPLFVDRLKRAGALTDADLQHMTQDVETEVSWAVDEAESGAWEPIEDLTRDVYTPAPDARTS